MPRKTAKTMSVMSIIAEHSARDGISGADIMRISGLWSGTAYPMLMRLLDAGWVTAHWEQGNPSELGRPLRRYYKISGVGQAELHAHALERESPVYGAAKETIA